MKKIYSILAILSVWFITSCSGQNTANSLSPKQFSSKMTATNNLTLVDVRTQGEYAEGHLKGALNIDWNSGAFESAVSGYDKSKNYFVYCRSGHRSGLAATWMREHGFKNVFELSGGISSWQSEGMPVE
jgi:rhodanese-related sulfurtransferase